MTVEALRRHPRTSEYIFCIGKGTAINFCNLRNSVRKPLLVKAGLPTDTHIHALRHSAITLLLSSRAPVNVVSDMAGHGDPSITLTIYGHILQGMQDGAADAMDDALSKRHCTVMQRPVQSQAVSYLLSLGG